MSDFPRDSHAKNLARPVAILASVALLVATALWYSGTGRTLATNPYTDGMSQAPTGAGSNPDGAGAVVEEGFPIERDAGAVIDGSADATDLTGITRAAPENTVADDDNRVLDPSDVISREDGSISNETGTVQAQGGS